MDQLSSCYFCGDALEASLTAHPVVPESLDPAPETQRSVVLCGPCKRKLDAVVKTVVDAVDEDTVAVETGGSNADIESTLGDDEEVLRPVGDDAHASDVERAAEESEMQWGDPGTKDDESTTGAGSQDEDADDGEETERKYTSSRRAGYRRGGTSGAAKRWNTTGRDDEADESDEGDETSAERQAAGQSESQAGDQSGSQAGDQSGSQAGDQSGSQVGDQSGSQAGDQSESQDTGQSGGRSGGHSAADGGNQRDEGEDDSPDVTLTRLENTKVMRLLQNREFPVEREDFVTVASSAYEVSPGDCDKVIQLAIDHDLLREEDGQLHPGAEWG